MTELLNFMKDNIDCADIKYGYQVGHYSLEESFVGIMEKLYEIDASDDEKYDTTMQFLHS